jgi:hypothetical protein
MGSIVLIWMTSLDLRQREAMRQDVRSIQRRTRCAGVILRSPSSTTAQASSVVSAGRRSMVDTYHRTAPQHSRLKAAVSR